MATKFIINTPVIDQQCRYQKRGECWWGEQGSKCRYKHTHIVNIQQQRSIVTLDTLYEMIQVLILNQQTITARLESLQQIETLPPLPRHCTAPREKNSRSPSPTRVPKSPRPQPISKQPRISQKQSQIKSPSLRSSNADIAPPHGVKKIERKEKEEKKQRTQHKQRKGKQGNKNKTRPYSKSPPPTRVPKSSRSQLIQSRNISPLQLKKAQRFCGGTVAKKQLPSMQPRFRQQIIRSGDKPRTTSPLQQQSKPQSFGKKSQSSTANKLKEIGNNLLREKKFDEAIKKYSDAIEICPSAIYYGNRAAAHIHLRNYSAAVTDAKEATKLDPTYTKGHAREGAAEFQQKHYFKALLAYENAAKSANEKDRSHYMNKMKICMSHLEPSNKLNADDAINDAMNKNYDIDERKMRSQVTQRKKSRPQLEPPRSHLPQQQSPSKQRPIEHKDGDNIEDDEDEDAQAKKAFVDFHIYDDFMAPDVMDTSLECFTVESFENLKKKFETENKERNITCFITWVIELIFMDKIHFPGARVQVNIIRDDLIENFLDWTYNDRVMQIILRGIYEEFTLNGSIAYKSLDDICD